MSEIDKIKYQIKTQLNGLCAHCATGGSKSHNCPVREISLRIESLRGVPLIVNSEFKGLLWGRV